MTQRTGSLRVQAPVQAVAVVPVPKIDCSDTTIKEVLGFLHSSSVVYQQLTDQGLVGPAELERQAFSDHLCCAFRVKAVLMAASREGRVVSHLTEIDQGRTLHQGIVIRGGELPRDTCRQISEEIARLFAQNPSVFPSAAEMKQMQAVVGKEVSGRS